MRQQRYVSIDFFKAIGIIYIIYLHQMVWIFLKGDGEGFIFEESSNSIFWFYYRSGLHVLGFQLALLAGLTFAISLLCRKRSWSYVFKRAIQLSCLGFMMNFLAWGAYSAFDWDILQFVGLSMIINYSVFKLNSQRVFSWFLIISSMMTLYFSSKYPLSDFSNTYLYQIAIGDKLGQHFWPLCPWFSLFAVGMWMGIQIFANNIKSLKWAISFGFSLLLFSVLTGQFYPEISMNNLWGASLFKPSAFFISGIIGFSLVFILLLHIALDRYERYFKFLKNPFISYFSYGILWIYIGTTVVGYILTKTVLDSFKFSYVQSIYLLFGLLSINFIGSFFIGKFIYDRKRN